MTQSLENIIRVSFSGGTQRLGNLNPNVLGIMTSESPAIADYGVFRTYLNPIQVGTDFGVNSNTAKMARAAFLQTPNLITGGGHLVVVPRLGSVSASPARLISNPIDITSITTDKSYTLKAVIGTAASADVDFGSLTSDDIASVDAFVTWLNRNVTTITFTGSGDVDRAIITILTTDTGSSAHIEIEDFTQTNTRFDLGDALGLAGESDDGAQSGIEDTLSAILRTYDQAGYFLLLHENIADNEIMESAALMENIHRMQIVYSSDFDFVEDVAEPLRAGGFKNTRALVHTVGAEEAMLFASAYGGRALSTDFNGVGTAITMNLKELRGLTKGDGITQTQIDSAEQAGVDIYVDFGTLRTFTSGANGYFDEVYYTLALRNRIQVAGYNTLAQSNTKIPQTPQGIRLLVNAYITVMRQFVDIGFFAPGQWNGTITIGDPEDFARNISDVGYYVFVEPLELQSQENREDREAPPISIAGKTSGAVHSSNIVVEIEE